MIYIYSLSYSVYLFKNFLGLVDEITNVLNTVSDLGEDSSVLAKDIANYERSLALVRYQLYNNYVIVSFY